LCVSIVLLSGREYGVYLGNLFDLRSCCGCLHEFPNTLHAVEAGMRLVQAHVKHYGPLALQDANRKVRECQTRSSAVLGARTITRAYAGDQKLANKVYQMLHSFAEDHRPAALLLLFQPWMEMTCLYAAYKRNCFVALDLWQCAKMRRSTCIPSSYYSSAVGSVTHGRIWPKRYVHTSRVRCQPA